MGLYRDEAVVLRTCKLGEADRIVTLLTRRHGRVRAVAKGVRRTRSRFGARLEPATHVDVQLAEGRSLDVVTQVESLGPFGARLAGDYPRHTVASAMLEAAERLTAEEREPALRLFLLLVGGLKALTEGEHDPRLVLDAFLLRALSLAGYAMSLDACARCGAPGPHRAFAIAAGGLACPQCRPAGAASPSPAAVFLLRDLLTGNWPGADSTEVGTRREASGLVAAYLQWHLERGLRSLPLVERSPAPPARVLDPA